MPRRSESDNPEIFRSKLVELLTNFEDQLKNDDLRFKVLALVPCQRLFRNLGCSLIPKQDANSGRDRILAYLRKYPSTVIGGEELAIVSGISDWPRRVRELRVEFGWSIVSGETAKEMLAEGEFPLGAVDVAQMKVDDYILITKQQDREAAHRWNIANQIRKQTDVGVRDKILGFLKQNVGKTVTGEELRYVANDKTEWARRVRELRTEQGWTVATKQTGREDLPIGAYVLESLRQLPPHDRDIPDDVRVVVLTRDKHGCVKCGWHHGMASASDPRHHLELHHLKEHVRGGENTADNLITVCNVCHDKIHREAKAKKR
jgi:hypothetical protein